MRGHKKEVRDGVWRLVLYVGRDATTGKKQQVWRTFAGTSREADDELARLITEIRDGQHSYPPGSVGDLLDRWMAVARLAPATRVDYKSAIASHVKPRLGGIDVAKLRAAHLDAFYADLEADGLGPARVRRCHNILQVALGRAVTWREVGSNVAKDASPPAVHRKEIRPPDTADVVRVLEIARGAVKVTVQRQRKGKPPVDVEFEPVPELVPYIYLAASTGARRSELCGLRWEDIDLDGRTVTFARAVVLVPGEILIEPTKTRRVRKVAVDPSTMMVLRGHRAAYVDAWDMEPPDAAFLFHRTVDPGVPWRGDVVSHQFARLRDAAGLPDLTIRQLRHYVATFLLGEGQDAVTVAGRLGHARPSTTTDIYAHFQPVKDRTAADTLGRALGG